MYPIKVPIYKWKNKKLCQIACRPDALSELVAELLIAFPQSAVRVGSVEYENGKVMSFLLSFEVPKASKAEVEKILDKYRTAP